MADSGSPRLLHGMLLRFSLHGVVLPSNLFVHSTCNIFGPLFGPAASE